MPLHPYKDFMHLSRAQRCRQLNVLETVGINNEIALNSSLRISSAPAYLVDNTKYANNLDDFSVASEDES